MWTACVGVVSTPCGASGYSSAHAPVTMHRPPSHSRHAIFSLRWSRFWGSIVLAMLSTSSNPPGRGVGSAEGVLPLAFTGWCQLWWFRQWWGGGNTGVVNGSHIMLRQVRKVRMVFADNLNVIEHILDARTPDNTLAVKNSIQERDGIVVAWTGGVGSDKVSSSLQVTKIGTGVS